MNMARDAYTQAVALELAGANLQWEAGLRLRVSFGLGPGAPTGAGGGFCSPESQLSLVLEAGLKCVPSPSMQHRPLSFVGGEVFYLSSSVFVSLRMRAIAGGRREVTLELKFELPGAPSSTLAATPAAIAGTAHSWLQGLLGQPRAQHRLETALRNLRLPRAEEVGGDGLSGRVDLGSVLAAIANGAAALKDLLLAVSLRSSAHNYVIVRVIGSKQRGQPLSFSFPQLLFASIQEVETPGGFTKAGGLKAHYQWGKIFDVGQLVFEGVPSAARLLTQGVSGGARFKQLPQQQQPPQAALLP